MLTATQAFLIIGLLFTFVNIIFNAINIILTPVSAIVGIDGLVLWNTIAGIKVSTLKEQCFAISAFFPTQLSATCWCFYFGALSTI